MEKTAAEPLVPYFGFDLDLWIPEILAG